MKKCLSFLRNAKRSIRLLKPLEDIQARPKLCIHFGYQYIFHDPLAPLVNPLLVFLFNTQSRFPSENFTLP